MYCPKCGLENTEDAKTCSSCGQSLSVPPDLPTSDIKTSKFAIFSLILAVLGLPPLCCITTLPALILGIIGLIEIRKSKGLLKGKGLAIAGIAISLIYLLLLCTLLPPLAKLHSEVPRFGCASNLHVLHKAIKAYAADHNDTYPPAKNWCDAIIKDYNVSQKQFCCPSGNAKEGQSSYALNINAAGKKVSGIPPDMVLIFETRPGVNPAGGQELLSTENHRDDGCNIVFADGHVNFIKSDEIEDLRWNPE